MTQNYNWSLLYGFNPGNMIRIKGTVSTAGRRFDVNFQTQDDFNVSDIILHISVRYGEGMIVMNTKERTVWQAEVKTQTLAITGGRQFELLVACEANQFRLGVNGLHFADFRMRRSHTDIKTLSVRGDVTLTQISYEPSGPGRQGVLGKPYPFPR